MLHRRLQRSRRPPSCPMVFVWDHTMSHRLKAENPRTLALSAHGCKVYLWGLETSLACIFLCRCSLLPRSWERSMCILPGSLSVQIDFTVLCVFSFLFELSYFAVARFDIL